jgi:beta-xylosidase
MPRYRNPIIDADFPDPDAIRVGERYYLISSSFNRAPGLPVLVSDDLVNWTHLSHALPALTPTEWYNLPRHGSGVWAPSIRHHDGVFHIVYPNVDQGVLVVSATDPAGPWSAPRVLLSGLGIIDPCPLWDDDGRAYLVHGWAASRSGRKNSLTVVPVDSGLTRPLGAGRTVVDGDLLPGYRTLEGPKFYKRDGWYWIFAPAGGVADGWQAAFRSRLPFGPYEARIVLEQGQTPVNGPHQGAWVDTPDGRHWFLHFQDRGVFGRVLHLQPMAWSDDGWPLIGEAAAGGPAQPVLEHPTPTGTIQGERTRTRSDDFAVGIGTQWSWQANPDAAWARPVDGGLVLRGMGSDTGNLRTLPHVLGQPLPGLASTSTVAVHLDGPDGSRAGLVILGRGYLWVGLQQRSGALHLVVATRDEGDLVESVLVDRVHDAGSLRLTVDVDLSASVTVRADECADPLVAGWQAVAGHWIGAEIGLFAAAPLGADAAEGTFGPFDIVVHDDTNR